MTKQGNVECKQYRTPSYVENYLDNNTKKENDRRRNRKRIL